MKPEEIKRWLRAKEYLMYHSAEDDTEIYESLARCRMLMWNIPSFFAGLATGILLGVLIWLIS